MGIYHENFNKWKDVQEAYSMEMKKPEQVLLAYYSYEDYSGSSYVIYREGDKYYFNYGGHCSCHGLEDQWDPTEFNSKEEFVAYMEKTKYYDAKDLLEKLVKRLKKKPKVTQNDTVPKD